MSLSSVFQNKKILSTANLSIVDETLWRTDRKRGSTFSTENGKPLAKIGLSLRHHHFYHHQWQSYQSSSSSSSASMTIISIIIIVIMNTVRSIEQVTGVRISSVCVWVNIVVNNLVFFLLSFLGIFSYFYLFILILLWTAWWQWQCAIASVGHLVFLFLICYIWHFCLKFHYKVGILTSAISKSCPLTRLQWPSFDPLHYFTKKSNNLEKKMINFWIRI